jgi:Type II secretion system (T2SS), protein G
MYKFWILGLLSLSLVGWLFLRMPREIHKMVSGGTEQVLAQWRDAMLAYKADQGHFPSIKEDRNLGESLLDALAPSEGDEKIYLDRTTVSSSGSLPVDGWGNFLTFDPLQNGDLSHVVSSGPDGIPGNGDDIDSQRVPQRNLPVPPDPNEEARSKGKAKVKTKP